MNLLDLMTEEQWNDFAKAMHQRHGISFAVSDTEGARVSSYANWCNRLCPRIKSDPQSLSTVCAVAAKHFTEKTRQSKQAEIGQCDLGLLKIAVPIFVGDTFLGTAGGCGFLTEDEDVESFLIQKLTGFDDVEVAMLVKEIKPMTMAAAEAMAAEVASEVAAIVQYHT